MEFQYKEMGTRIKVRRKELKIKQAELAEALEISNNHMSSIENGRQKPSLDTFIGICRCLNVGSVYKDHTGIYHSVIQRLVQDMRKDFLAYLWRKSLAKSITYRCEMGDLIQ